MLASATRLRLVQSTARRTISLSLRSPAILTTTTTTRSYSATKSTLKQSNTPTPTPTTSTNPETDPSSPTTPPPSSTTSDPSPSASSDVTSPSPAPPTASLERTTSLAESYLNLDLDLPPPPPSSSSSSGGRTGARAKGSAKSSIEKKRQRMTYSLLGVGALSLFGAAYYLAREWDDELEKMRIVGRSDDRAAIGDLEEGGWKSVWGRARLRGSDLLDYMNKPAWDPLLPAPLQEPYYRPYTLVVDLDNLLVHSSWDLEHGWRTAKRPGVDYFLAYLSQFYEIVLFTTQPSYTALPIIEKIDPYGAYIPWKLFRESTRYKNNAVIKDLSYLGRPLERTIILDTDPTNVQLQTSNAILLSPWLGPASGPETTKELVGLIPFLEAVAIRGVKDVRSVIGFYEGKHIPTAYAEAEMRAKKEVRDKWEREREAGKGVVGWLKGAVGGLVKNPNADGPPETDVERVRKNAQRMYLEEQKYWKDNEAIIKEQMDQDREKQLKEMKSSLAGMVGLAAPKAP